MQKVLFIILSLLFTSSLAFSQWQQVNPVPTSSTTYMGAAPSADKYITVLDLIQHIVITTDGGLTWSRTGLPQSGQIRSCYFLNDNVGWVGGAGSILYKTTDGGLTWNFVPNIDTIKYDVHFITENDGWATGFRGFVMKTADGGTNWISRSITHLTTSTMYGIFALSRDTVFVAGSGVSTDVNSGLYRTTNDGETWTPFTSPFGTYTNFREVKFVSPTTGFAVGSNTRIVKTTDRGQTWTAAYSGSAVQLWGVSFNSTGTTGLATGASSTVLRTTDGGSTWTPVTGFPSGLTLYSIRFAKDNDNIVYMSGSSGYFFKSTDAGATWTELSKRFTSTRLRDVSFANNDTGYVVGTGFIAKTTDSGFNWVTQTSPYSGDINEVSAASANVVIAGCDAGNVVRTSDGGTTWTQVATGITGSNTDILAIDFINPGLGMVVGYNGGTGISENGGLTWKPGGSAASTSVWDLDMVDNEYAWCVDASGKIFRTTDGGAAWEMQFDAAEAMYGVSFINRSIGIMGGSGGAVYFTTNGGTTWTPATTPPTSTIWGIHIAESPVYGSVALTACAGGDQFKSTDGGNTWTVEPDMSISTFDDVTMTDAAHAWVVGNSGTIIRYYEPGNIPVELQSFTALSSVNSVTLSWTTATEVNNKGFEIERYNNIKSEQSGTDVWTKVAFISGKGTSTEPSAYSYTDMNLAAGSYNYRLKQIDFDGIYKYYTLSETVQVGTPGEFRLSQNYPNPFNPSTKIKFGIPSDAYVTLKIYNSLGEEAAALISTDLKAGYYETEFNGADLTSGIYYYKLTAGNYTETKKMVLVK